MKKPSKNISNSLRGQRAPGRSGAEVTTGKLSPGGSMTVPGEGTVSQPPGKRNPNSAKNFADATGRLVGSKG